MSPTTTMRTTDIALARPTSIWAKAVWKIAITTDSVLVPGPPSVMMKNWLNARNEYTTEMIRLSAIDRRNSGSVSRRSALHQEAPSTRADSYNSVGMPCIPAISSIMVSPAANQITRTLIAVRASPVCTSHAVESFTMPNLASTKFAVPESGCSSTTAMKLSATSPTMYGRKIIVRNTVDPGRLARTNTARAYPKTKIGTVTIPVYFRVNMMDCKNTEL